MLWEIIFTKQGYKDFQKIKKSPLFPQAKRILSELSKNPFYFPPKFEPLVGNFAGLFSRRLNVQHRIVYEVLQKKRQVKVLSMWNHYDNV